MTRDIADRAHGRAGWRLAIVTGPTKVLLVSGSLSTESVNSAVLRTAAALAGDRISTTLYEGLRTLPHFNPDNNPDGGPVPAAVADLRRRLAEADAVPFCAPEHAGSLPGSFKNPLDWTVGGGETYGKPVAWINASSCPDPDAGSGAHDTLRTVLGNTGADIAVAPNPGTANRTRSRRDDPRCGDPRRGRHGAEDGADSAAPTSRPARPRTAPGPA